MQYAPDLYRNLDLESVFQPPKTTEGAIICGAEASATLGRLLLLANQYRLADPQTLAQIDKLKRAAEQAKHDHDTRRRGGNRLKNHIQEAPGWSLLIPFRAEPAGFPLDSIRLAILLALLQSWQSRASDDKDLSIRVTGERLVQAGRLTRPTPRTREPALTAAELLAEHFALGQVPDVDLDISNSITKQIVGAEVIASHLKALQHLLIAISDNVAKTIARRGVSRGKANEKPQEPTNPQPTASNKPVEGAPQRRPPVGPRSFHQATRVPENFNSAELGLPRSDAGLTETRVRGETSSIELGQTPSAERRSASSQYTMWLMDQCLPGSARAASGAEFIASLARLQVLATPKGSGWTAANDHALIASLSATTTRHWEVVAQVKRYRPGMQIVPGKLYIDTSRGVWLSHLPEVRDRWDPPAPIRRKGFNCFVEGYHPWTEIICLPLLQWQTALLRKIADARPADELFSSCDETAIRELTADLRANVSPNVTFARLRAFVVAGIIQRTGNVTSCQALSGQSLGHSDADLHYWTSRIDAFVRDYTDALEGCGPLSPGPTPQPGDPKYIAISRLALLHDDPVKALASKLQSNLQEAIRAKAPRHPQGRLAWWLRQITAQSIYGKAMYEANVGGRLTHWLDEMTVDDLVFDHYPSDEYATNRQKKKKPGERMVDAYCQAVGIRRDKIQPPLNLSRVVAMAPLAIQQCTAILEALSAFTDYLTEEQGLDEMQRKQLLGTLQDALSGCGPMFLRWDGERLIPISSDFLKAQFPSDVADNFLRHRVCRRLTDLGASPLDVAIHMGHHFFGPPFGDDSTFTIHQFTRRLNPTIDLYLRHDGWRVERIPATKGQCWQHCLTVQWDCWIKHRADCRELDQHLRQAREDFHKIRKDSLAEVDIAIERALAAQIPGFSLANPMPGITVDDLVLEKIIRGVQAAMSSDALREIAARRLRFWVQSLIDHHQWRASLPGLIYQRLEPHDAISRQHARAYRIVRQVQRLLAHEHERSQLAPEHAKPWRGIEPASSDPACSFVATLLFDLRVTNPDAVLAALRGLPDMVTVATLPGVGIIPLTQPRAVKSDPDEADTGAEEQTSGSLAIAGRPLALALSLRAAMRAEKQEERPSLPSMRSELTEVVRRALPPSIRGSEKITWSTYADVVEMAQKLDVAGPAPLSREAGINTTLPIDRLVSLLLNETSAKVLSMTPMMVRTREPLRGETTPDFCQYDELVSALNDLSKIANKATQSRAVNTLAEAGTATKSTKGEAPYCVQTIEKLSTAGTSNVRLLARFARHLLLREAHRASRRRPPPANTKDQESRRGPKLQPVTAHAYLTRFGRVLLKELGGRELSALDEEDVVGIFRTAIYSKSVSEQRYTYDRIAEFYHFLRQSGSIARVSLGEILEDLPDIQSHCEAAVVTATEFDFAVKQLRHWYKEAVKLPEESREPTRRLIRASGIIMTVMYRLGLRSGECRRLRFADLTSVGHSLLTHAHSNQLGSAKSYHSNRAPDLALWASPEECKALNRWLTEEKQSQGLEYRDINPIFSKDDNKQEPLDAWRVMDVITQALRLATGNPHARPHWLRHSRAMSWLSPQLIPGRIVQGLASSATAPLPPMHPVIRGLWICRQLGHSRLATSLRCYEHIRQLSSTYRLIRDQRRLTTRELAHSASIDEVAIRQRCDALKTDTHYGRHWYHAVRTYVIWRHDVRLERPVGRKPRLISRLPFSQMTRKHLTLNSLLDVLSDLQHLEQLPGIQRRYGLSRQRMLALLDCFLNWQLQTGYWLVPARHMEQLRRELGAKERLAYNVRAPSSAQTVQLKPVRDLLNIVSSVSTADWRCRRGQLRNVMYAFRDGAFHAVTIEQQQDLAEIASWFGLVVDGEHLIRQTESGEWDSVSHRHVFCSLLLVDALQRSRRQSATKADGVNETINERDTFLL